METSPPARPSTGPPPPRPPFGTPRPRQLRRRPDQGPIAGVCAGVAEYFAIDPVIVRIAAVVLALSGPGLVAYVLAWIFVPEAPRSEPAAPFTGKPSDRRDRGAQIFGIVLLAVSLSILWGGWWSPARRWVLPLGLMALGAWLLLRREPDVDPPADFAGPPPAGGGADSSVPWAAATPSGPADATLAGGGGADETLVDETLAGDALDEVLVADDATGGGAHPPWGQGPWSAGAAPPPLNPEELAARRRKRMVFPIVMGALLLWSGIAFLGGVSVESGLAVALCIVGLGFVLGAFVGGSKALIVPAFLLGVALLAATVIDIPLSGPIGHRTWAPRSLDEVEDHYELSVGEGIIDLSELSIGAGDRVEISASVGVGHLVLDVPDGVALDISAESSVGDATLLGQSSAGVGVSVDRTYAGTGSAGTIVLDLQVGFGQIEVRRLPAPARDTPSIPQPTTTATLR